MLISNENIMPLGILLAGFLSSPERPIPASIPIRAGKNTENTFQKL